ncbi:hypothetical protein HGM15179_021943, partial [Zosterops borbonicus]
ALPTLGTLVGPLPGVDVPVLDEMVLLLEALPTVRAEVGAGLKLLPTLGTLVGSLPSVDAPVPDEEGGERKGEGEKWDWGWRRGIWGDLKVSKCVWGCSRG